jgi:hypothetical protein
MDKMMKSLPPEDHNYGFFRESVEEYAERWGITPPQLWQAFGANALIIDRKTGKVVYHAEDVVKAVKKVLKTRILPKPSERSLP